MAAIPISTALLTQSKLLTDSGFQHRVAMAILHTASMVLSEDPATPDHANRVALAKNTMRDPGAYSRAMYNYVIVQPDIYPNAADPSLISDDDVQNTVNSMWNTWAGQMADVAPSMGGMPFPSYRP
jgi:hypothetical protein